MPSPSFTRSRRASLTRTLQLLVVVPTATVSANLFVKEERIINGFTAPGGRYPYSVTLQDGSHFCGGSLIAKDTVLTAAHCMGGTRSVRIGSDNVNGGEQINVKQEVIHPYYNKITDENDIAIVFLEKSTFYNIPLVKLNADDSFPREGSKVLAMGWGDTDAGSSTIVSSNLMAVELDVISNRDCEKASKGGDNYAGWIYDNMLCTETDNKDACQGDSGGPLVVRLDEDDPSQDIQVGIVSWGVGCAYLPGVFSRVSQGFDWIQETVCDEKDGSAYPPGSLCGFAETEDLTDIPTRKPTPLPTKFPTPFPTKFPTNNPTKFLTKVPTKYPTKNPTRFPTRFPTKNPTRFPTRFPTKNPTRSPTESPTTTPTHYPTASPTTSEPTASPTLSPTDMPSVSVAPTGSPSASPTESSEPTGQPSESPSISLEPTGAPSSSPTTSTQPTESPSVSLNPTSAPSTSPTTTSRPTSSQWPTTTPTLRPSGKPSSQPSVEPTSQPSGVPSQLPTTSSAPTTQPSLAPSSGPSLSPTVSAPPTATISPSISSVPTMAPIVEKSDRKIPGSSLLISDASVLVGDEDKLDNSSNRKGCNIVMGALFSGIISAWLVL